jgi:hypothetical protein
LQAYLLDSKQAYLLAILFAIKLVIFKDSFLSNLKAYLKTNIYNGRGAGAWAAFIKRKPLQPGRGFGVSGD